MLIVPVASPSMNHTGIYTARRSSGGRGSSSEPGRYLAKRDLTRPLPELFRDTQGAICLTASFQENANGRAGVHTQRVSLLNPKRVKLAVKSAT